jgi:hypothetical protein
MFPANAKILLKAADGSITRALTVGAGNAPDDGDAWPSNWVAWAHRDE